MSDRSQWLAAVLLGLAVGGVALAPSLTPHPAGRKTDERVEALAAQVKKLSDTQRGLDGRLFHLEELEGDLKADVARAMPQDARWIELAQGGRDQWDFDVGGRVQVQFLAPAEGGAFTLQINSRAGESKAAFRPGTSLSAVDDRGSSQRRYITTLQRVELDRDGHPARGLVSVVVESR